MPVKRLSGRVTGLPEWSNSDRLRVARAALDALVRQSTNVGHFDHLHRGDQIDAATDLLANVMHLCQQQSIDFEHCLELARMHFGEEVVDG